MFLIYSYILLSEWMKENSVDTLHNSDLFLQISEKVTAFIGGMGYYRSIYLYDWSSEK